MRSSHAHAVCAGSDLPLALVTVDPPTRTLFDAAPSRGGLRREGRSKPRPLIEHVADQLIDDLLAAGPPADIYARFCHPFPNLVHMTCSGWTPLICRILLPRMTVAWSSGRYHADEVTKAALDLREYFESQVIRSRHAGASGGLIDALVQEESASRLTDAEIVMLSHGSAHVGRRDDRQSPRVGAY